ncbi:MFS transporter [Novosphingobium sp. SL115]|uniref:MFS transporter n=1 Tax=Novosphingobium sp. SL115 TaxID=2995150 RepID=UPI0022738055|nr:MFS transporter [Novosphingobium sp. SL115]MCY1672769.1 MFS transporter [Novosphingobium sp. SL115]
MDSNAPGRFGTVDSAHSGSVGRAWLTVATLFLAQIVSTIDRGMLALVIDPVRADLGISEMQIALLQGFAFSIFYVTVGLPLGAVADAVNRRKLLLAGIAVWSAATVAGGFAAGFGSMFASRLFIGVGEAVLGPCAVTMISDLFPPERRGRPMALYVFGSMIAFGLGSLICGLILDLAPQGAFAGLPVIGKLAPWRIAFVLVGLSGVVLLALLATLREPPRTVAAAAPGHEKLSFGQGMRAMGRQYRLFVPYYLALALFAVGGVVATGWGAVFLTRIFAYDIGSAGKALGLAQVLWAALGVVAAGIVVDRVGRRFGVAGRMRLAAGLTVLALPSALPQFAGSGTMAIVMLGELMFVMAIYGTTMLSVLSEIAPPSLRGFAVALYAFVMTLIGGSLGPVAVAWLTQSVFADPQAVGWSMAIVGTLAFTLSALLAFVAAAQFQAIRKVT